MPTFIPNPAFRTAIIDRLDEMHVAAGARYNERYQNSVYLIATQGKSVAYCNRLIDDAMALCGCPFVKFSQKSYDPFATGFLALFV